MPSTSKGKKSVPNQKGKKSPILFGQKVTRQKGTPEWKIVKPKELETIAQEGNRERFGFSRVSIEIKEFKAGGSSKPEFAHPNIIPNRPGFVSEKAVVVDDVVMSMSSSAPKTDDNTKKNFAIQELLRQPLAEISTNHHEEGANQTSSMEIEIRNISKAALKRIDPKFLPKKVGKEEKVDPPNDQDDEALGNPTNGQVVDLIPLERDM